MHHKEAPDCKQSRGIFQGGSRTGQVNQMSNSSELTKDKRLNCQEVEQFRVKVSAVIISLHELLR